MTVYKIYLNDSIMMVEKAFVLINTDDHIDDDILIAQLKKIDGISELNPTRYLESIIYW